MSDWSKGFVEANGLEIAYHRTGVGSHKPAIVLLHGYTDNGLCWFRLARDLESAYDVIMLDARGHGQTRGKVVDLEIDRLASDAAEAIQALGLDKPFVFGHSMGAMTALGVGANYPHLVRATLLEDPVFLPDPLPPLPDDMDQQLEEEMRKSLAFHDLPLDMRLARGRTDNPNWSEDEQWPWAEAKGEYNPDIVKHRMEIALYDWRKVIAKLQAPLLLITADNAKGAIVSPAVAQEAQQLFKRCEIAHISGAGHCIHRDRYAEALHSVTDFLERVLRVGP
jgi:N-formylmaleamate deformylase